MTGLIELYVNEAVAVGNNIYFVAGNTGCLYKYSIATQEIVLEAVIRTVSGEETLKFVALVLYKTKIWMVPCREKHFWIYDIETKECFYMAVPELGDEAWKYRKVTHSGQYIWAVHQYGRQIIEIDMENESYRLFKGYGEEDNISIDKVAFKSISFENGKLYLFRDEWKYNVIINVADGSVEKWNFPVSKEFGMVAKQKAVISPVKTGNTVRIYSLSDREAKLDKEYILSDEAWGRDERYAYWQPVLVGNNIFIMPIETDTIFYFDLEYKNARSISLKTEGYAAIRYSNYHAISDVLEIDKKYWLVPYLGNQWVVLDEEGGISEVRPIRFYYDFEDRPLDYYLKEIICYSFKPWKNDRENKKEGAEVIDKKIGSKIYNAIINE